MTPIHPIKCEWTGEALVPAGKHWANRADQQYVVGESYMVEIRQERSLNSHRHYFAAINESHANLPDHLAEQFPTPDALRRYALIRTGYRDERSIVAATPAEARAIAAFIKPMDSYAVVVVNDCVVTVYNAKSQSLRAMGRAQFSESKNAVLDFLSRMIGVERESLDKNAGAAA